MDWGYNLAACIEIIRGAEERNYAEAARWALKAAAQKDARAQSYLCIGGD